MKKLHVIFYFFSLITLISLLITSCNPSDKKSSVIKRKKALIVHHLKDEASFDKQVKEIDSFILANGKVATSLDYSKENGESIQVDAHLDDAEKFLLVQENFTSAQEGESGVRYYYFNKNKVFVTKEIFQNAVNISNPTFTERVSYYAPNGICVKTKERKGSSPDILERIPFTAVPKYVCNIDKAMRALNREEEFRLTFQGFINSTQGKYMVIGEPGKQGYTTALKIDKPDNFIQEIEKDEMRFINATIYLNFERILETNGFKFQRYLKGSWSKIN